MGVFVGRIAASRLTAVSVNAKKDPGYYSDGNGLYLQISSSGSKSWVLRYMLNRKAREMGLGSLAKYTLAEARDKAKKYRQLLDDGIDPIEFRKEQQRKNLEATQSFKTFEECAITYHSVHAHTWKNSKHADQWINTLTTYAFPTIGKMNVSQISKSDILKILEPIWLEKAETASRVRQRIKSVLDWASARDYRKNHDPAIWDQIKQSLPKGQPAKNSKHFASCPYKGVAGLIKTVRDSNAAENIKDALEFIVLTATRSGEVRGAKWSEIDLKEARWIIPGERMKAGKEHRIPLSPRAIEILRRQDRNESDFVFPNTKGSAYSDMTFTMLLRRLGYDYTVHGFRSSFRDWSAEQTNYPREVCEAALAHTLKDATEAAYFRSDLFDKRREMMVEWASFTTEIPQH